MIVANVPLHHQRSRSGTLPADYPAMRGAYTQGRNGEEGPRHTLRIYLEPCC